MLKVKKLTDGAKTPTVAHPGEDLGYDLYADLDIPGHSNDIFAHGTRMFNTGIAIEFDPPAGGLILTRSSMAKNGIIVIGGVIDVGYRGEVKVMLANLTNRAYKIVHGDKIGQLLMYPFAATEAIVVPELTEAGRSEKGFGSSGR